jgi:hypothetical protein
LDECFGDFWDRSRHKAPRTPFNAVISVH